MRILHTEAQICVYKDSFSGKYSTQVQTMLAEWLALTDIHLTKLQKVWTVLL